MAVTMTPEQALRDARAGKLRPVYLLLGEEAYLKDALLRELAEVVDTGPAKGFNDDKMVATDTTAEGVVAAVRTVPMMAPMRFVIVTAVERWDKGSASKRNHPLDVLASYAADPVDSAVLVLVANKINGGRKLVKAAKKGGYLIKCEPLSRRELPAWVRAKAKLAGNPLAPGVDAALCELVGPELGPVADAIERLSLYVGKGETITEDALAEVVTRVRHETVWALVDALGARALGDALAALHDAYDARDAGLPLLGAIAWRVRQLLKFQAAIRGGGSQNDAAKAAGIPPFRAADVERTARQLSPRKLEAWLLLLAEADLALKGSRRPGSEVLATMLIDMCA
jgi:DNA polymerase-3 subunit delta